MHPFSITAVHSAYLKALHDQDFYREGHKSLLEITENAKTAFAATGHETAEIRSPRLETELGPLEIFTKCPADNPSNCVHRLFKHEQLWKHTTQWEEASHKHNVSIIF